MSINWYTLSLKYADREHLLSRDAAECYREHLVGFIVDEAHCIKSWGAEFRKAFQRLGETRSLMPSFHLLVLANEKPFF